MTSSTFMPQELASTLSGGVGVSIHVGLNAIDPSHYGTDGHLAGAENDARAMQSLAASIGYNTSLFLTQEAQAEPVLRKIDEAAKRLQAGDTLLLTYAGHGAQVVDQSADEPDQRDETWCVYDRMIIDDELSAAWRSFAPGVLIVVVADSCHSQTSTRLLFRGGLPPVPRAIPQKLAQSAYENRRGLYDARRGVALASASEPQLAEVITLSACQDNQVASDGAEHGLFTEKLLQVWSPQFSGGYQDLINQIRLRMPTPDGQTPGLDAADPLSEAVRRPAFRLSTGSIVPAAGPTQMSSGPTPPESCALGAGQMPAPDNPKETITMSTTMIPTSTIDNGNWDFVAIQLAQQLEAFGGSSGSRDLNGSMNQLIESNAAAAERIYVSRQAPVVGQASRGGSVFQAYWWGFHVLVSHEDLDSALKATDPNGDFIRFLRTVLPQDYQGWIDAIAPFVVAGASLMRLLDHGRGVYISMLWFAPGAFVPTSA